MNIPQDVHFDFSAALVVLTAVTGIVWVLDVFLLEPRRRLAAEGAESTDTSADDNTPTTGEAGKATAMSPLHRAGPFVEFCASFFPVILIVLVLRSFVVEPFRIPSGSMLPTLNIGDFILVNKFSYGLRLPVLHTRVVDLGEPQRGDVIVFRHPPDPTKDYIKRVVGMPGDEIRYVNKRLYINDRRVETEFNGNYSSSSVPEFADAQNLTEYLDGVDHQILIYPQRGSFREGRWEVPHGHYFVMGDNRDNSEDSRAWGFVPERHLVGKAFFIWMSWDVSRGRPDFSRIGKGIY